MSAQIDIVLLDGGDNVAPSSGASPAEMPSRTVYPSESASGSRGGSSASRTVGGDDARKKKDEPSAFAAGADLAAAISRALGGVALVDTALKLRDSFQKVYDSVMKFDGAVNGAAESKSAPSGSTSVTPEQTTSRTKSPADDFIEGEFEIVRPATSEAPTSERGLSTVLRKPAESVGQTIATRTVQSGISTELAAARTVASGAGAAQAGAGAARGLAAVASAAGPLAVAIGAAAVAAGAGAAALKSAFDAINNATQEAANYSGEVATALSMTEVRRELAGIQRADKIGPELARFENMRAKLEDKGQELWTEILAVLVKLANAAEPIFDVVGNGIDVLTASAELTNAQLATVIDFFDGGDFDFAKHAEALTAAAGKQTRAVQDLLTFQKEQELEEEGDRFMNQFLAQFGPVGQQI